MIFTPRDHHNTILAAADRVGEFVIAISGGTQVNVACLAVQYDCIE